MWPHGNCELGWCFSHSVIRRADYASSFVTEKAKLRSKGSLPDAQMDSELTAHLVPRLQDEDIMFADLHSLRRQATIPGMYNSHRIGALLQCRCLLLGTAKHEHRRTSLYNILRSYTRLILVALAFARFSRR